MAEEASIVYIADPMCSWCYGFGPQFDRFIENHPLPVRLVMGGLYVGARAPALDEEMRAYLRETWARVEKMSGRPFSLALLDRHGWTYDTEWSCRAVVAMRSLAPGNELRFLSLLQRAFYQDGVDLTDDFAYPELLAGFPVDVADFMLIVRSEENREQTRADFELAAATGFGGFPTVLVDNGERIPLAVGYKSEQQMSRTFHVVAAEAAVAVCADVGACGPARPVKPAG